MNSLNIVGAGRAARVIARLGLDAGIWQMAGINNRSVPSSAAAQAFLGSGTIAPRLEVLPRADVWLLGVGDDALASLAAELADTRLIRPGDLVFHLSGSLSSTLLAPLAAAGARCASFHPLCSFADPVLAFGSFAGTWCGVEGEAGAVEQLEKLAKQIGAHPFRLDPAGKVLYHAGAVFACNYLVVLLDNSLRCYEAAGVPRETAIQALQPLLRGTLDNISQLGTAHALTGPIARGDAGVVAGHLSALQGALPALEQPYRQLGLQALQLAAAAGRLNPPALDALRQLLDN